MIVNNVNNSGNAFKMSNMSKTIIKSDTRIENLRLINIKKLISNKKSFPLKISGQGIV